MTIQTTDASLIELAMIQQDAHFLYDLVHSVQSSKHVGIMSFGFVPYYSLITYESFRYFNTIAPEYARQIKLQYEDLIRSSRLKIKLFDGEDIVQAFTWVSEYHRLWYNAKHVGLRAWRKAFQQDLGVYFYNDHIISTTHVALLNIGVAKDAHGSFDFGLMENLSPLVYDFSVKIGEYLGGLYMALVANQGTPATPLCQYTLNDQLFRYRDVRAASYYKAIFNGPTSAEVNACLSLLLSALNFARHILSPMAVDQSGTLVKLKFITLYHVTLSLKKVRETYWPQQVLTDRSKSFINSILKNKELEQITKQSPLRNILVHYALEDVPLAQLDLSLGLYGLVEYFFQGRSMTELDDLLDQQIARIAAALEEWLAYEQKS